MLSSTKSVPELISPRSIDRSQYEYRRAAAIADYRRRKETVRKSRICHLIIIGLILFVVGVCLYVHFVSHGYFDKTFFRRVVVDGVEVEVFSENFLYPDNSEVIGGNAGTGSNEILSQLSGEDKSKSLLYEKWGSVLDVDRVQCDLNSVGSGDDIDDLPGLTLEERTSLKLQRIYCKEQHEDIAAYNKQKKEWVSSNIGEPVEKTTSNEGPGHFLPLIAVVRTLIPFLFMIFGLRCLLLAYNYLYYPRDSFYSKDCNKLMKDKPFKEALEEIHDFSLHRDRDESIPLTKYDVAELWKEKDSTTVFSKSFGALLGNSDKTSICTNSPVDAPTGVAHTDGTLLTEHMKLNRTSASVSAGAFRIPNFYTQEAANRMLFKFGDKNVTEKVADDTSVTSGRFLKDTNDEMKQRGYMRREWLIDNPSAGDRERMYDEGYPNYALQPSRGHGVDVEFGDNSKGALTSVVDDGMLRGSIGGTEEELVLARLQSLMVGRGTGESISLSSVERIVSLYTSLRKLAMWRILGVQNPNASIINARRWVFLVFQELDRDIKRCNANLSRYGMGLYDCSLCLSMPDPSGGTPQTCTATTPGFGQISSSVAGFGAVPASNSGFGFPTGAVGTSGSLGTAFTGGFGTSTTATPALNNNVTSGIPFPTGRSSMSCLITEKEKLMLQPPDIVSMDKIQSINHRITLEGVLEIAGAAVYKAAAALSESTVTPGQPAQPSPYLHPKERQYRRAYIISRISTFSRQESRLPSYRNNGIDCEGWDDSLPQDPHLVAHIISARVALLSRAFKLPHMPGLSTSVSQVSIHGNTVKDSARIIMSSIGEPYFYVAVGNEGSPMSSGASVCMNSATGRYTSNFSGDNQLGCSDIPSFVISAGHNTFYRTSENGDSLFESLVIFASLQSKLGNTFSSCDDIHSTDLLKVAI